MNTGNLIPRWKQAVLAALSIGSLLAACSDDGAKTDTKSDAIESTVSAGEPAQQIAAASAAPIVPAPSIAISLRGVTDDTVEQGEPLRVALRLSVPRDNEERFELAPAENTWADAIAVELVPVDGGSVVARAVALGKPDNSQATIDSQHIAGGLWHIDAETMQDIPPGDYMLRARLVIIDGSGWTGEVVSDDLPLHVVATSDSAERVAQRAISLAGDAMLDGDLEHAATLLDAVLENTPDDVRVLTLRGAVAERAGNMLAAMICVNRALQASSRTGTDLPPLELNALHDRVLLWLASEKPAEQEAPPAWSWPPAAVLISATTSLPTLPANPASPASASASATTGPGSVVPPGELDDAIILADPAGQWAVSSSAGSEYGTTNYGAVQLIGIPDVSGSGGDSGYAWCHNSASTGLEWIELGYAMPVYATEVRVRQNNVPGTIVRVEAIESDGTSHVWWEGVDPHRPTEDIDLAWFAVRVPTTPYRVAKIKVTLDLAALPGWKEIDAVQLVAGNQ